MYADNVVIYLQNPNQLMPILNELLTQHVQVFGFRINDRKSVIMRVFYVNRAGVFDYCQSRWSKSVKYLGIRLVDSLDQQELSEVNFKPMVNAVFKKLET